VLEGSGGQELAEEQTNELTEENGGEKECEGAPANGRGAGETVQSQRSGRKSRRGDEIFLLGGVSGRLVVLLLIRYDT